MLIRQTERTSGSVSADISRLIVWLVAEYTGRSPTKARTTIRDDTIICVTQDNMTKAERRLTAEGETDLVVTIRRKFQTTMREDLVGGVELLTGRKVLSFVSDHDGEADYAAEVFILDGPPVVEAAATTQPPPAESVGAKPAHVRAAAAIRRASMRREQSSGRPSRTRRV